MIHLLRVVEERRRGKRGAAGGPRTNSITDSIGSGSPVRSLTSSPFSRAHPTHPPIELIVGWGAPPGLCPGPASWTRDGADA
jgi:hypothetical protein